MLDLAQRPKELIIKSTENTNSSMHSELQGYIIDR